MRSRSPRKGSRNCNRSNSAERIQAHSRWRGSCSLLGMRLMYGSAIAVALAMLATPVIGAQGQETTRTVAGGGITAKGWQGKADGAGKVEDAKLSEEGKDLHVTTGPAMTYWNPANKATGNYTVKATFNEPKYMNLNNHPHPYGIVIAGNDMPIAIPMPASSRPWRRKSPVTSRASAPSAMRMPISFTRCEAT